jgi:hypothetical protein
MKTNISIVIIVMLVLACASTNLTTTQSTVKTSLTTSSSDEYAEIPFNMEIKATNLPSIEGPGNVKVIISALINIENIVISLETSGGIEVDGNQTWEGSIPIGMPLQLEFPLKATLEGPASIVITSSTSIRDISMKRIGTVSAGVGKRGTLVEDIQYSAKMGE